MNLTGSWEDIPPTRDATRQPASQPQIAKQRIERPTKAKFKFLELYAGFKGFTAAVVEVNGDQVEAMKPLELYDGWDILTPEGLEEARTMAREMRTTSTWPFHAEATPRPDSPINTGTWRQCAPKRNQKAGDPVAEEGSKHLAAVEIILMEAVKGGATVSVENPWDSFLWETAKMKKLEKRLGLTAVYLDQCAYGGMSKKPTKILTNAPWMQTVNLTCGQVRQHKHSKLEGKVWDPVTKGMVWKTSRAAEYPSGLCHAWANALKTYLQEGHGQQLLQKKTFEKVGLHQNVLVRADLKRSTVPSPLTAEPSGQPDDKAVKLLTAKERREAENERAIGGLRNPRASVARNSHLRTTGLKLRRVLDAAVTPEALHDFQSCPTESPFSPEAMAQVREALATEFSTTATHSGYEKKILQALLEQSHDPDAFVIPKWLNESFPLGIIHPIPHTGIFPQTEDVSAECRLCAGEW